MCVLKRIVNYFVMLQIKKKKKKKKKILFSSTFMEYVKHLKALRAYLENKRGRKNS